MNKNNKTLFNPYVGVIIVFLLFSYFAYQGYQKDKIAEKVDDVTKTIHIQEQAKTYQDNLTSLTDISKRQLITNQKQALEKDLKGEIAGKLVFSSQDLFSLFFKERIATRLV